MSLGVTAERPEFMGPQWRRNTHHSAPEPEKIIGFCIGVDESGTGEWRKKPGWSPALSLTIRDTLARSPHSSEHCFLMRTPVIISYARCWYRAP